MVELFTAVICLTVPEVSLLRSGLLPGSELPTLARLSEVPNGTLEPPGQDLNAVRRPHLLRMMTALAPRPRSVRIAPARGKLLRRSLRMHRIELPDYSTNEPLAYECKRPPIGLLGKASVEPDKHLSMHPALRVNRTAGGKNPAPLDRMVSSALPGAIACQSLSCLPPLTG